MKSKVLKSILVLGLVILAFGTYSSAYADPVATLKEVQGEVFWQAAGSAPDQWQAITQETAVNDGDSVKTGAGSCTLAYADQGDFRLEANTSITIQQQSDTQDINLKLGMLKAKINKEKIIKPFQVVTPTAVGAVRGTEVDFSFNEQGQLTIDLHNGGPVVVYNDEASMELTLQDGNKITVSYDKATGQITVTNSGDSAGSITFSIEGKEYTLGKGESQTIDVGQTAAGDNNPPDTDQDTAGSENTPNEDAPPPPSSPV